MSAVVIVRDRGVLTVHREGCRDVAGDTDAQSGWDVDSLADLAEQAYGDASYAGVFRVMPCVGGEPCLNAPTRGRTSG